MSSYIGWWWVRKIVSISLIMACGSPEYGGAERVSASLMYPQRKMAGNNRLQVADGSAHMLPEPEPIVAL